jgi:hypothetical protein
MKVGRKPKHAFHTLKIGEKTLMTGGAKKYPHQSITQYNKNHDEQLRVVKEGGKVYAERFK